MATDPIGEAHHLTQKVAELLNRALATNGLAGHERSEVRYAEALARTLLDELEQVRRVDHE